VATPAGEISIVRLMQQSTSQHTRESVELAVCRLFAELVGVDTVRPDEDFFDIGGHSLLAAEAVGTLRRQYNVTLRLPDFLEDPTAAWVCDVIVPQLS
jgi:hypothetical protein